MSQYLFRLRPNVTVEPPIHRRQPSGEALGPGRRVLVVGLGRFGGGVGVSRWLTEQGCRVTVTDLADPHSLSDSLADLGGLGITYRLGRHDESDLDATDLVIVSPAVPKPKSAFFQSVVRRKIPWTTEINLFCERCPAPVIGITGTYGKSTTCAMLAHVLETCRETAGADYSGVHLGGNIGRSLLMDLPEIRNTDLVVLELSNAQLEDLPRIGWAPALAVITNLSPHHLDRYDGYDGYLDAKLNIIGTPRKGQRVFAGQCEQHAWERLAGRCAPLTTEIIRVEPPSTPLSLGVPGGHNQANAAMVLAICRSVGLDEERVRASLASFPGLPHRLQRICTLDGVDYYDDSKSTSPAATAIAIDTLASPVVVIIGGQAKDVSPTPMLEAVQRGCRAAICLGESGPAWANALRQNECRTGPSVHEADDLRSAVAFARRTAQPGDAVLFSPGAPSFDAYGNFAERGKAFVRVVEALS